MSDVLKPGDITDDMSVTAIRSFTYNLKIIYDQLVADGAEDLTIDELIRVAESFAQEDLSCGYGHYIESEDIDFSYDLGNAVSYE